MNRPHQARTFLIRVGSHSYTGIFLCSVDAVLDAMDRYPEAQRIAVSSK